MENIGLNSDIQAGDKNFHIQTQFLEPSEKIVSNVFENGKVITSKTIPVNGESKSQDIKTDVQKLHRGISEELELLFYISEKVGTIQHAVSNNKLGMIFLEKNLFDEAIKEFKRALEIDPDFVEGYKNLGCAYIKKNMLIEARDVLIQGIEKKDDYADLHNNLGRAYLLLSEFQSAFKEFNKALQINPDYESALFNLSVTNIRTIVDDVQDSTLPTQIDRIKSARSLLTALRDRNQIFKKQYLNSALELIEDNKFIDAYKVLENAESDILNSNDIPSLENEFYLNFMFGGKGKDDEFVAEYTKKLQQAIDKHPEYADLKNDLGIAYLIQCRNLFLKGLNEFRNALEINPEYKRAEKNLKLAENDGKGFLILLRAILK
jgi:tetratricopeptide (TPR) repeat protein